jgi:ParB family chromosome partitioning protein
MAKIKGLGRGLDALLGGDEHAAPLTMHDRQAELAIDMLQPGKYQPRTHMDEAALQDLARSIAAQGIIQPVLVRNVPDTAALAMALIENIQREDLNPLEQANGIQRLITEFGITHEQAAEMVGRSRSAVTNLLRLLGLAAPVRELVQQGRLDMGHARALLALSGMQQIETARLVVERGLSVRDTERMIGRLIKGVAGKKPHRVTDRDILRLQEDLSQKLGTKVVIKPGSKGHGALIIDYTSLAQLDAILARVMR